MARDYRFAVVDVETTGLFPSAHDRVIEIAIVIMTHQGKVEDEYATLVNPQRDLGPTHIHGLTGRDVLDAPVFAEVAADVAHRLGGNVFVAHNALFDYGFVDAEFERLGHALPSIPVLCTMRLAQQLVDAPSFSLAGLCAHLHIDGGRAHCALDDARSTARLLSTLLSKPNARHACNWESWSPCVPFAKSLGLSGGGRVYTRQHSAQKIALPYLSQLVEKLPTSNVYPSGEALEYVDLLSRVLEDRRVTAAEADLLLDTAIRWGLTKEQVEDVHRQYLHVLADTALEDGRVTTAERQELNDVAQLLGQDSNDVDALLSSTTSTRARSAARAAVTQRPQSLSGRSVCFTGESRLSFRGAPLVRELAEELAKRKGLVVKTSVTKSLDILVVADPDSLSGKARKARQYGVRIIAERVFWQSLDVEVG